MNRKNIALKNSSLGFLLKILNMGIVYLTIPYLLRFLGKESYGIWVTIFSIISIVFFLDGGIINGLKTNLTKEISLGNKKKAKEIITNAYVIIGGISILFFALGTFLISTLDLQKFLNTVIVGKQELKAVFFISFTFICFNFILSIYKSLFYAIQKVAFVEFSIFIYQLIIFFSIFFAINNMYSSLITVAYIYGFTSVLIGLLFTVIFFIKRPQLIPSIKSFNRKTINNLLNISVGFFVIQLCMIIIFTSDNLLISNLLGPEAVASFDVVFKLFQVIITLVLLLVEPFWPLFTDAYQKRDFNWIYKVFKIYNKLFLLFVPFMIIFCFLVNPILSLWVGESFKVDHVLLMILFLFTLVRVYPFIYMYFLNGIGKIKSQIILYILGAIVNIPASIILVKYYSLGVKGIVIGTILSIIAMAILLPIKSYSILKTQ